MRRMDNNQANNVEDVDKIYKNMIRAFKEDLVA